MDNNFDKHQILVDENSKRFFYRGISMHPTLKHGYMLYAQPVIRDLVPGDVIIFYDAKKQMNVVHRIVSTEGEFFYTRGDNNPSKDPLPISLSQILGKVTWIDHYGKLKHLQGGRKGLFRLRYRSFQKKIIFILQRFLYPLYHLLDQSGIVPKLWRPKIQKVSINTDQGKIVKYLHRKKTVAIWNPTQGTFNYRHPYNLILKRPQ